MKRISRHWTDSISWLCYNLLGIGIPVVGGIVIAYATQRTFAMGSITNGGQFSIYSIAMMITTLYLLAKSSERRLPWTQAFGLLFIVGFCAALIFFILAVLFMNGEDIPAWLLEWPTIGIFLFCIAVAFLAFVADKQRQVPEIDRGDFGRIKEDNQMSLIEQVKRQRMEKGETDE